jgi:hypothetical protein
LRGPNLLCDPYLCNDVAGGVPFWAILLLIILVALLIATFVGPRRDPPTLEKAVDDVLDRYQQQAVTWGDDEAATAFGNARADVRRVVRNYRSVFRPE